MTATHDGAELLRTAFETRNDVAWRVFADWVQEHLPDNGGWLEVGITHQVWVRVAMPAGGTHYRVVCPALARRPAAFVLPGRLWYRLRDLLN